MLERVSGLGALAQPRNFEETTQLAMQTGGRVETRGRPFSTLATKHRGRLPV